MSQSLDSKEQPPLAYHWFLLGWIVSKFEFIQRFLYTTAGFNVLRELDLGHAKERWTPNVVPIASEADLPYIPNIDPSSFQDLLNNIPGRYHTVLDYHAKYLSKELTPLAVIESLLPLIRREVTVPSHHSLSFIAKNVSSVLAAAKESTAHFAAGKSFGILDGVPTAIKDSSDIAGYQTTNGRAENDAFPIAETTTCMYEYGTDTTGLNPNWGTPQNPHNKKYYPGGSSSGSACAVAAGLMPFAFGADGGGSIRIPTAFCGIYGFKPTFGRLEDIGSTVAVTGPLAATMTDLEAMYRVMAQPDPSEPTGQFFAPPSTNLTAISQAKTIGIYKPWFARADDSVLEPCQNAVDYFQNELGYTVVPIEIPYISAGQKAHLADLNPANKIALGVGAQTTAQDYPLAQQMRNILMQHLAFLFKKYPGLLIVTPTCPMPGWDIKSERDLKYGSTNGNLTFRSVEYVWIANLCGNPAINVPVDPVETAGEGKIPIGLMAMDDWGSEDQLLGWGREAEIYLNHVYEGGRKRPNGEGWVDVFKLASG
ncbi:putative glutamyl-trna amidotransferase subunit a protein [Botrytis fragariae]|uniref:Putative glutamyl-trna amidotransferase subunit a protein n=1 Tax=Botrytis fragariae TaxID=1964551 RepID=A0A8H6AKD2_9HELO|nr:putative glutamyl-trna amidotransferase subunit a protein [Botrytis fragariae]KAF5869318.1 putative glutamyl-trna amidotransferase subunit a protein [Botrytis fragariae]